MHSHTGRSRLWLCASDGTGDLIGELLQTSCTQVGSRKTGTGDPLSKPALERNFLLVPERECPRGSPMELKKRVQHETRRVAQRVSSNRISRSCLLPAGSFEPSFTSTKAVISQTSIKAYSALLHDHGYSTLRKFGYETIRCTCFSINVHKGSGVVRRSVPSEFGFACSTGHQVTVQLREGANE